MFCQLSLRALLFLVPIFLTAQQRYIPLKGFSSHIYEQFDAEISLDEFSGLSYGVKEKNDLHLQDEGRHNLILPSYEVFARVIVYKNTMLDEQRQICKSIKLLPLSWLEGKAERDVITCFCLDPLKLTVLRMQLTCKQAKEQSVFDVSDKPIMFNDFQAALEVLKKNFVKNPKAYQYSAEELKQLLQEKILEQYEDENGQPHYRHGPQGFELPEKYKKVIVYATYKKEKDQCVIN